MTTDEENLYRRPGENAPPTTFFSGEARRVLDDFEALYSRNDIREAELHEYMESHSEVIPVPWLLGHDLQWNSVLSQFEISRGNIADFAFLTKHSGQWRIVFIELERPQKRLFIDSPHVDFHSETRQAIAQVQAWKACINNDPKRVIEAFHPLMKPVRFWTNPVDFRYVLIIGRNPKGDFPTREHASCVKQLADESDILLVTYDSIGRMSSRTGIGYPKNILAHLDDSFRVKRGQADTNLFSYFGCNEISMDDAQAQWFINNKYDIASWNRGQMLTLGNKRPGSQNGEDWREIFSEMSRRAATDSSSQPGA